MACSFLWPWRPAPCSYNVLIRKQGWSLLPPGSPLSWLEGHPGPAHAAWEGQAEQPCDKQATGNRICLGDDTQGRLFSSGKSPASDALPKITRFLRGLMTMGCH